MSRIDLYLFLPSVLLILIGCVTLSSVAPGAFPLQFLYIAISLFTFLFFAKFDIELTKSYASILYIISIILLLATFLFGQNIRGAVRWIDLGVISLQTSEVIKPLLLIFFAWSISRKSSFSRFIESFLFFLLPAYLIFIQPDLGSTIVLLAGFLGIVFIGGLPTRFITLGSLLSLVGIPLIWRFLEDYQRIRIFSFLDPQAWALGAGYNSIQAKIAVGSGEFFGRGLGQGTQSQLLFLPEKHTDFIFSSIAEEFGFIGAFLLILCFTAILVRLIFILKQSENKFTQCLLGGIFCVFFAQSAVNIGMNLGILPITGIPLPFVSSGGSSLVAMSAILGIASALSTRLKPSLRSGII